MIIRGHIVFWEIVFDSFVISRPNLGCSHWLEYLFIYILIYENVVMLHFARASNWVNDATSFFSVGSQLFLDQTICDNFHPFFYPSNSTHI